MESDAEYDSAADGRNVTLIAQFAPAARVAGHALDSAKADGFGPPRIMLEMFSGAFPVLETVSI
jgi:hypothetical protein